MDDMSALELVEGTAFAHTTAGPAASEIRPAPARTTSAPASRARQLRAIAGLLLDLAVFLCLTVALVLATLLTPWHWSWKRPWKKKEPADSPPDWM